MFFKVIKSEDLRLIDMAFDLVGLTDKPEREAKESSKENRLGRVILGFVRVRRISPANSDILWGVPAISTPVMSRWDRIASANGSMAKINRSGESGQPCRVPLQMEKGTDSKP